VPEAHVATQSGPSTDGPDGRGRRDRRHVTGRLGWRLLGALLTGLLLAVAFPPFGVWPLAVLAVAATTLLVRGLRAWPAALVGFVVGAAFFLLQLRWLLVIGADAWSLLSLVEAVFFAALGAGLAVVQRLRWWPVWAAGLWVAEELARAVVPFGGFPWGRLAFAMSAAPFRGLAALGGMPLVSYAVALAGSLLAAAAVGVSRRPAPARRALLVAGVVVVALSGLAVPLPTDGRTVTAAVVQGDVPRSGLDAFGQRAAVLDNHVETTTALAQQVAAGTAPQPQLVVWPENSTDIDPYADRTARDAIQGAVDAIKAPTLVGAVVTNPADPRTVLNLGIVWAPATGGAGGSAGGPGETYAKRHPVPFGEYVPFRGLLTRFITRLDRVPRDFAAGHRPGVLQLGPVRVGDVICFEVAYDNLVTDVARADPGLLVVQTNNATYGRTGQPDQQLAMSRLRAIETGRTVLVAATSGLSAVIAPDGRLVAASHEFERWTYDGPVVVRSGETVATRLGPWPGLVLGSVGIAAVAVAVVRRRRERSRATDASPSEHA
jgi:apolipoprotein N-acyltransferase